MKKLLLLTALLTIFYTDQAQAENLFDWHSTNIQLLRGHAYELGERKRTISTIEHAHGHAFGDTYAFIDIIKPDGEDTTYYGEFAPRLSLSKTLNVDLSHGILKDVLVSTMVEKPNHAGPRYLYGLAADLNVPGFKFLKTNYFIRDDTQLDGDTWQVTVAWNRPFKIGTANFVAEGFTDIAGGEGPTKTNNQLIVPRFLMDVGDLVGLQSGKLWAGIEYSYWHNKAGVDGVTESAPQAQIKFVF